MEAWKWRVKFSMTVTAYNFRRNRNAARRRGIHVDTSVASHLNAIIHAIVGIGKLYLFILAAVAQRRGAKKRHV